MSAVPETVKGTGPGGVHTRVLLAALVVGACTVMVSALSFVRDAVLARQLGLGDPLDALVTALLLPTLGASVLGGSLTLALIPVYIEVRNGSGPAEAWATARRALLRVSGALLALALVAAVAAPWLLGPLATGFGPDKLEQSVRLLRVLLPMLVLSGATGVFTALLNAEQRFLLAALAPALVPGAAVAVAIADGGALSVEKVAVATTLGAVLCAVVLAAALLRMQRHPTPSATASRAHERVMSEYWPMVAGALLMSGMAIVNQAMVSGLEAGSVAALSYGGKVVGVLGGIGSLAIGSAVLPHFSQLVAQDAGDILRRHAFGYTAAVVGLASLAAVAVAVLSPELVRVLFGGRAFDDSHVALVAQVQVMQSLQLPFLLGGLVGARVLSALGRNRWLMVIGGLNVLINYLGNRLLLPELGVAGVALATSVTYICSFIAIMWCVVIATRPSFFSRGAPHPATSPRMQVNS